MDTQNNLSMKMNFFPNKSLINKVKIVWKTLVVLLLSVLLFAPTPVLALDYGSLQSYISNTKVELDGVLTSIEKLPGQSYENGKTTLAEVGSKLEKIKTDAGKNAKNFQNLSNESQREYEKVLAQINNARTAQELIMSNFQALISNEPKPGLGPMNDRTILLQSKEILTRQMQTLPKVIVLTSKISKLCDALEKRVKLAKQKVGNVKEYADVLESFSDSDILSEIGELDIFVTNLTNNLVLGS